MIDFELDEKGDIFLEKQNKISPFRLNFTTGEFNKLRISFMARTRKKKAAQNALKINFQFKQKPSREFCRLGVVKRDKEKAQSIAIRLKTELGELNSFYHDFGSKLVTMRHLDLLNDANWSRLEEKVKTAIQDIIPYDESVVTISRSFRNGSFKNETLNITILDKNSSDSIAYTI